MRFYPLTLIAVTIFSHPMLAQHPASVFEAKPILPQPFEAKSFRAVEVPRWLQDTTGVGYTLSGMSAAARTDAAKHGVTISEMNFVDPFYPYYNSAILKRRSPHVPIERIEAEVAEYKKLGIRILAVYPPTLQGEVYDTHRDWRRIPTDTTQIPQVDMKALPHGGMLCLLSPYGDFFIEVLAEILTKFPEVDAFSFDGLHHGGVCYCEHCRKNYKADTGKAIPKDNLNNPEYRRYQHWADRKLEALIQRTQTRLKAIKPEVALVTWTTNAGRFGHFLSVPRNMPARLNLLFDAPDQELWLDESNRGNSIVPAFGVAYAWSVTNHRVAFSEPYLMSHGNPYGKDSFPTAEVLRRMLLCTTYGCSPSIAVNQPARLQKGVYNSLDEIQKRKPWMTHKTPERWAAILMSDNAKTFYGRTSGRVEERYLAHPFGAFRAAIEGHLPVNLIDDWNVTDEDLKPYAVVVLPNAACLDERQVQALDRYVRNGGGLVASLDCSLFDEYGDARNQFALASLFGVDYRGVPKAVKPNEAIDVNFAKTIGPDYWEKRRNVYSFQLNAKSMFLKNERLAEYIGTDPVTMKGPAVHVLPHPDSTVEATIQNAETGAAGLPAIITRSHGKGRVVYHAAGFDAAYYQYSYPYQRLLLNESIAWAAGETPMPVEVRAPMCVHSTIMRQVKAGRERLVVHLFNNVNSSGGHAMPNDDVPLREETVPIYQIPATFAARYRIRSVRLEPEGIDLPIRTIDGRTTVVVPKLEIHSMIVAELERNP